MSTTIHQTAKGPIWFIRLETFFTSPKTVTSVLYNTHALHTDTKLKQDYFIPKKTVLLLNYCLSVFKTPKPVDSTQLRASHVRVGCKRLGEERTAKSLKSTC